MSITIFYKGNLKQPNDISDLIQIVKEKAEQYHWSILQSDFDGVAIDIPDCETLVFNFEKGKLHNFVKYVGQDLLVIDKIFDILLAVKPFFKRLMVTDDFGAWYDYVSQFSKDKFPLFRELKDIEKEELARWFDLSEGSDSIFGMKLAQAVLMYMICKDMNDDLTKIMRKDMLLSKINKQLDLSFYNLDRNDEIFQFRIIVESWIVSKLVDKNGVPIQRKVKKVNGYEIFSWLMSEIIFGCSSGFLDAKHSMLHRFVDLLTSQKFDFGDAETFLRLIYSVMEYLGIYRNDDLITRRTDISCSHLMLIKN